MKKNKVLIVVTATILCTTLLTSCLDEFLEADPQGKYTSQNYFNSEDAAVNSVSSIYSIMLSDAFTGHDDATYDACSDDIYNNGDHYDFDIPINRFTCTPTEGLLPNYQWQTKYEMISRANLVIINIPKMSSDIISSDIRNRCLGESYFFRAYAHWWLYLVHGEIPIITEDDVNKNNYNKPKSSIDEVLSQIEADLLKAVSLLPETASQIGRVHRGSAYAYLAQLYMHWSCYDGKDFMLDKAIEAGNHIINNPKYALADNFADNFTLLNGDQTTTELLLQMNGANGVTALRQDLENGYFWTIGDWGGWPFWQPTKSLVDEFGDDPRVKATILKDGDIVTVSGESKIFRSSMSTTGYAFRKNAQLRLNGTNFAVNLNQVFAVMRSSDVYLLVAEAKIRKGESGDAEINAVRARVGLPALHNATKEDLIHERRLELAGENRRFFDLRRWDRIGWVDIVSILAKPDSYNGISRTFIRPKHYFFPIPQQQLDKTNGILVQNSEYL